jgi:hypothetical protein
MLTYKITFKCVIDHWSQGPVPGRGPAVEKHWAIECQVNNVVSSENWQVHYTRHRSGRSLYQVHDVIYVEEPWELRKTCQNNYSPYRGLNRERPEYETGPKTVGTGMNVHLTLSTERWTLHSKVRQPPWCTKNAVDTSPWSWSSVLKMEAPRPPKRWFPTTILHGLATCNLALLRPTRHAEWN